MNIQQKGMGNEIVRNASVTLQRALFSGLSFVGVVKCIPREIKHSQPPWFGGFRSLHGSA